MNDDSSNQPPPPYGPVGGTYPPGPPPPDGAYTPVPQVPPPGADMEPPPKYEQPKEGPYAQAPAGYYPPAGGPPPTGPQGYYPGPLPGQPMEGQQMYTAQPQPGYGTVHHQTIVVRDPGYGTNPRTIECPNCHALVTTETSFVTGGLTWLSAGLICLFGCWLGCCLIPFCIPDLQDVQHKCPNCGRHIGTHVRL